MVRLSILAAPMASVSLAGAFCVDFNSADQCYGKVVGKYIGSIGTDCQTAFTRVNSSESIPAPGGAFNVVTQPGSNDGGTGVAFYGQPDCEVLIGFGNVAVCTGVGAWSSFKVISINEADDELTNLDPAPILSIPSNATEAIGRGDLLSFPTRMPGEMTGTAVTGTDSETGAITSTQTTTTMDRDTIRTTSEAMMSIMGTTNPGSIERNNSPKIGKRIVHGSVHRHQGRSYKYHQVAARAWRGVPVDEWNEEIHKRDTKDYAAPAKRRQSPARLHARAIGHVRGSKIESSKRRPFHPSSSALKGRSIVLSKCNLIRSCMIDSGDTDGFGISDAGPALLSALGNLNPNGTNWQFLRAPFVVEVADDSMQSIGFIYAQTIEHSGVSTCSDSGSEGDAFTSALEMGVAGSTVSDMKVDLKLLAGNGVTNSLFVSTRKAGNADMRIHLICAAIQVFD
ncbi:MAG: hypothetical protein Q9178_004555 [Gyalolechia marmorata]